MLNFNAYSYYFTKTKKIIKKKHLDYVISATAKFLKEQKI